MWHFIVASYEGKNGKIYVDGLLINQEFSIYTFLLQTNFIIGNDDLSGYDRWFNGLIDDVRIYNRALTDQEILKLYNE